MTFECPTSKGKVKKPGDGDAESARFFPFCSQRCKLIDLGAWLDGQYIIPAGETQHGIGNEKDQPRRV
jgi:hypothetical protein